MKKAKLYGDSGNFRTQKVLIAARYGHCELEVINEQPPQDLFPFQVSPAYDDGEVQLFGASSIALRVGSQHMHGQTHDQYPEVVQWLQFSEGQLIPTVLGFVLPSVSAMSVDKKKLEESKNELMTLAGLLNDYLMSRTFLVGERLTLADISVALDFLPAYQHVFEPSLRDSLVNLNRWFQTIVNQPEIREIVGEVELCEKTEHYEEKKHKELMAKCGHREDHSRHKMWHHHHHQDKEGAKKKAAGDDVSGGKKKEKKKIDKSSAEEKEADKNEDEEMDETEAAMAREPKQADPFAEMPKSTFNMDAFKRVYSNEDTLEKAIPYFWEHFDAKNYSIWFSEYLYPEDLKMIFMSCNLIGGMFQRLEKLRKNAFASVCLFGENNNSTISGIWVWRGHELAFSLSPDWQIDYESYKWTKLDPNEEKTKQLVKEYFAWEGTFDGKEFNQGKIFK